MIDVLRYRGLCALFSLAIAASFIGFSVYRQQTRGYVFSYSVDFTGGAQVLLRFEKAVNALQLKGILENTGWQGVVTREFSERELLVRVKADQVSSEAIGAAEKMQQSIIKALPENPVTVLQSETVGPGVGEALRGKSIRAIVYSLLAMLAYIALTFWSLGFAAGAVVALFHDALVMLASFLFFDREISVNVIAAILAVMGYSINDTIVIFSQIRQNMKTHQEMPLASVVNMSINQTLRRTLLTSISTGLPVLAMVILGGEALRDFALALLVGIVFGTYSSIYIASPVMMLLERNKSE